MRRMRNAIMGGAVLLIGLGAVATTHTYASSAAAVTAHKQVVATEANNAYLFSPKKITVKVGTKVTWNNVSDAEHTVTSKSFGWAFDKTFASGKSISFVFKKAGTYKYFCSIHPYMHGTIVVH